MMIQERMFSQDEEDRDGYYKPMRVDRLMELLRAAPPDAHVYCNRVFNLVFYNADDSVVGYVDFAEESVDFWNGGPPEGE